MREAGTGEGFHADLPHNLAHAATAASPGEASGRTETAPTSPLSTTACLLLGERTICIEQLVFLVGQLLAEVGCIGDLAFAPLGLPAARRTCEGCMSKCGLDVSHNGCGCALA